MTSYIESHAMPGKGRQYDAVYRTDHWHQYLWAREQVVLRRLVPTLFGDRPVRLLDFACGTGRITEVMETEVAESVGVDVSPSMLEVARQKLRRTTIVEGNLLDGAPLPHARYDLITAFRFFVNAEPPLRAAVLRTLAPLLADDGYLVFNNHQNLDSAYIRITRAYAHLKDFPFANTLSMRECAALLDAAGLELVHVHAVAMLHLPRLVLPHAVYAAADRVADAFPRLARFAESPILVARRRR